MRALRLLRESKFDDFPVYYTVTNESVKSVIDKWVNRNQKPYDEQLHGIYPIKAILPYREYLWSKNCRRQNQAEWDDLVRSIKKGFQKDHPIILEIGQNGEVKVGEGNHRIAVALELGIRNIPVRFYCKDAVRLSSVSFRCSPLQDFEYAEQELQLKHKQIDRAELKKQKLSKKPNWKKHTSKEVQDAEQKQLDDIMDLILKR